MADYSVNYLLNIINKEVDSREILSEHLFKAETLTHVAMNDNFLDYPKLIMYYYLWVLNDIILKMKELNDQSLDMLLKKFSIRTSFS